METKMSDRPYIICHMIMSIDGKILTRRWEKCTESKMTGKHYESTAAEFDVGSWMVGTTTMKELTGQTRAFSASNKVVPGGDFIADTNAKTFAIGTDTRGVLKFQESEIGGDHAIVLTSGIASTGYLAHLRNVGVSYLLCGRDKIDLKLAMKKLHTKFNLKKILLEGGGVVNGSMLQAKLVDEISQLIIPIVDGGGSAITGFFDPPGKAPKNAVAGLKLISQKTLQGGTQWLRYEVNY